jgi:uncharacterized protein (DUF2267 family)
MRYDEFIERVLEKSGLDSRGRAIDFTKATLETLGERLDRTVRRGVASQLPDELKELLLSRGDNDIYEVQEFYRRIGARADTNYNDAAKRAKTVIGVLQEAISAGEVQDMIESLPEQYAKLFDGDQSGPGFPSLDRS